jgi:hypothetical protein
LWLASAFFGIRSFSFQPINPLNFQQFYQHQFNLTCNFSLQFCSRLFYSVGNKFNHVVVQTGLAVNRDSSKVGAITSKGSGRKLRAGALDVITTSQGDYDGKYGDYRIYIRFGGFVFCYDG